MGLIEATDYLEDLDLAQREVWDITWSCTVASQATEGAVRAELELESG